MAFLARQFKQGVAKPFKQLGGVGRLWEELLPAELAGHTRLESLRRGVLKVAVDSSSRLYELDRLLRGGLEQELIRRHRGGVTRVALHVGTVAPPPD